ncbi:arabinose ABC transporter permease [Kocuria flava]|uniref:Arabinose ABC transporter permease n=1 Tax=Kocuria flava TaxID=446860 RepID=A0A0U2WVM3_9MICC|nr:MFS transporter [Kocuria flava]ALU40404.1 arabinose ABC transporter permease [Kocuria flava]GEO92498.1 MFS transporter [Kocuria flava]
MPTQPAAPDRDRVPQQITVLIAAAFVIAVGYGIVAPVLPQFATTFGVGVSAAGAVVSAFALARLLFAPAGGRILARIGERPTYVVGVLVVAVSSAATAFAQSYWQLLVFRGLGGIGSVMFTISAMGLIVRLAPPRMRGRVSGYYASAFLLGGVLGPVIGGLLAGLGLQAPFLIYAAALLVAVAVVHFRLRDEVLGEGRAGAAQPVLTPREAWSVGAYRAAVASNFANGWTSYGIRVALVPLLAVAVLGAGPGVAGLALAVFAAGNALALTVTGRLTDRFGRRPLVLVGLVVNGVATTALGLSGDVVTFVVLSLVAGMGSGTMNPGQQAAVADVIGPDRSGGPVLARYQMSADAGQILGPVVAGALADAAGFGWAFGVSGALMLLAALAWLPVRDTLPRTAD